MRLQVEHRAVVREQGRRREMIKPQAVVEKIVRRADLRHLGQAEEARAIVLGKLPEHTRAGGVIGVITATERRRSERPRAALGHGPQQHPGRQHRQQ